MPCIILYAYIGVQMSRIVKHCIILKSFKQVMCGTGHKKTSDVVAFNEVGLNGFGQLSNK